MKFLNLIADPAVLIVISVFLSILIYTATRFIFVNSQLTKVITFLKTFKKTDLSYRFKELDTWMTSNKFLSNTWYEFKNTLVFSESLSLKQNSGMVFENVSQSVANIQTTVDPIYFFNEETLVTSKYNSKFVQAAPTLLTGMGPLFTFMYIAIAFSKIDFSSQEQTIASVSNLMGSMQIAALCSVLAVGFSLIYILFEKITYNKLCKMHLDIVQEQFYSLFDNISSEKFLIELLKETKLQNNAITNLLTTLPTQFKEGFDKSLANTLVPYLENVIFSVNKLKDKIVEDTKKNTEAIDELF